MTEANQVLAQFLPEYNRKFTVPARESGSAYRKPGQDFKPEEYFCFKYRRVVGIDNVVRFGEQRLQILPTNYRQSYARCQVEVQLGLDNSLTIYFEKQPLKTQPAPLEAAVLRKPLVAAKPASQRQPVKPTASIPGSNGNIVN